MTNEGFSCCPSLEELDTRGSPLEEFPADLLRNLSSLRTLFSDNYKLCCSQLLPDDFNINNCFAKQSALDSCEDLLKLDFYRAALWIFAILALSGNAGSFVSRVILSGKRQGSFGIFVTNLCFADVLMGVYLTVIGVVDIVYQGQYVFKDIQWKKSDLCLVAGFLSLVSSEVSAFTICLITLDRFLVLRFPFSRVHFGVKTALASCTAGWVAGVCLAAYPLLPSVKHWNFFGQTGICVPLPFTDENQFAGYHYSFGVMIVLNFVLFLLIATGQQTIYWSIQVNTMSNVRESSSRDTAIARRLTTIAVSDFLCWFPIGLLGLLAYNGVAVSGDLNVVVAIFVLPFNAAFNPFLYTFNVLMEKRRSRVQAKLMKQLEDEINCKTRST